MQDTELNRNETLANRLADILIRLNSGYKLDPAVLAKEYDTHPRTIKRDFDRFEACRIPLQKEDKCYFLDPKYLGKLSFKDMGFMPTDQHTNVRCLFACDSQLMLYLTKHV